eukprot:TRINITY_DN24878_c0_g1_i1.p1 TRINITY_DN24878_c0_g1~~TRINITY_DN24878_c0_g1_i1.p1  ORF type:complete len:681 (+),score=92.01 TRINITY_DN24878_c0_g1_i1:116-2158(+)
MHVGRRVTLMLRTFRGNHALRAAHPCGRRRAPVAGVNQRFERVAPFASIARAEYNKMHLSSLHDRDAFWSAAAKDIDWIEPYTKIVDESNPPHYRWFTGGKINVCHNAVDRHLATRADQVALIYDSPITGSLRSITYKELHDKVSRLAGVLLAKDVKPGDRVLIYMPLIPEAVYSMLACARIGAVHSVVFGGFGVSELAVRLDDSEAKVVLAASCGIEPHKVVDYGPLLNAAIDVAAHKPAAVVVKQRLQCPWTFVEGRDTDWDGELAGAEPAGCVPVDSDHPLYILYTSGSTGKPKGVVRDSAAHIVTLKWSMTHFMRTLPGETYWAASDVGWVVGHSYIVYGPLLQGCSSVLFEGKPVGTPDAATFWRIISQHSVTGFFTAPTSLRAIRREDPHLEMMKRYDMSSLKNFFVAGERCDPATAEAFSDAIGMPVKDNWWQTETGWPICGFQDEAIGMKPGSASLPMPGYDIRILDENGQELPNGTPGMIAAKLPLPPSCFSTLWRGDENYVKTYMTQFPGYYATGDAGLIDSDGYVTVLERTDDVINVSAHRLSSGQVEAVVKAQEGVSDAAVIGVACDFKGQVPIALAILNADATEREEEILENIRLAVRREIGPIGTLAAASTIPQLPKTRSGKVLRKLMRRMADGAEVNVPGTIEDPNSVNVLRETLSKLGYPKECS